jgi:hypothetical protein
MSKVREGLAKRNWEREAQKNWFEAWFNSSPWFSTLISTLVGLLVILLLILTFGPCILNKLVTLVKDRISTVQLMILRQQYERLSSPEIIYANRLDEHDSSL